jgi:hypothetical protein
MHSTFLADESSYVIMLPVRAAMHTIVKIFFQVFATMDLSTGNAGQ